jgi:hypothetical protein
MRWSARTGPRQRTIRVESLQILLGVAVCGERLDTGVERGVIGRAGSRVVETPWMPTRAIGIPDDVGEHLDRYRQVDLEYALCSPESLFGVADTVV